MKNKIIYFFIIVLLLCSCSNKQSNKENSEVGFFNEKKNINETAKTISPIMKDNFGNTYILNIFDVFSQKLILQSEVFFIDYLDTYDQVFEISLINKLDYVIVEIQNRIGVSAYELFIRERNNKLEIFKQTGWDRISYKFEIAKDDYDNTNANLI